MFKMIAGMLATALLLAGCGGGTTLTSPPTTGGGGNTPTVATVTVAASPATVAADGSTSAAISAVVVDAGNAALSGVKVTFKVSAGGVVSVTRDVTDAAGLATGTVKASTAAAGTSLTVTATAGTVSGTATVGVVALQQALSVATDSPQIPSDNSKSAAITAQLTDANNNALSGVTVKFTTPTAGVLTVTQAVTDASGLAKATLAAGTDPTNRRIVVTASAGSAAPASVPVDVTGTTLSLTGPANLVLNNFGTYSVLLTDSSGKGIANRPVTLASTNGNMLSAASVITDGTGQASMKLTATSTANAGVDSLSATALGLTVKRTITVSSDSFSITAPADGTKVSLGTSQTVTANWLNGGTAQVGKTVSFSASRGTVSAGTMVTDGSGNASVAISSTNAGAAVISATGTGVSAQINVDFIATLPSQIAVQASPATVAIQGQSTITATVRDAANNLVEGQTVNFVLTDSTGGSMSVAAAVTDAQGRASSIYTAGNTTSAANGVSIAATVAGTPVSGTTTLSVGGQAIMLSLGTGNTIDVTDSASYSIVYDVFAADTHGAAIANAPITLKILPVSYVKGQRVWSDIAAYWTTVTSTLPGEASCANEDTDFSGNINSLGTVTAFCPNPPVLPTTPTPAKDANCNGSLEPGNVATVSPSTGTTGTDGKLAVKVTYTRDHAYYVTVQLVATTSVNGTQGSTSSTFLLPGASSDFSTKTTGPPGPFSPYGTASACSNPR